MADHLYQYTFPGYSVTLYPNRLEIENRACLMKNKQTILLRNITKVDLPFMMPLIIHTADGKKMQINVSNKPAEELRDKLNELL